MLKLYPKMGMAIAAILLGSNAFSQCITPLDQTVTPANTNVICGGNATVSVASTETGISYFLRNDANNSIVDGPVAGTGNAITFNTGTVTSSTDYNVYADKLTGGLHFDGGNDYVSSPEITMGATFTFETWVKTNDDSPVWSGIITTNTRAGSGMFAQFSLADNGTLRWETNSPNSYIPNMSTVINDNIWHHVAVVSDGSSLTFYVDGNVENTISFAAGSFTRNIQFMCEREANGFVPGTMDEARVWSIARTQPEIQASMNGCNLTGTETGLEIYYSFEDGTGSTVTDLAGGDQDGTLVNMNSGTAWATGIADCNSCPIEMSGKSSITVNSITDQAISAAQTTFCNSGSTTIDLASSEISVNYYLRNDLDYVVVGPIAGTGAGISFNTGTISATTTYDVLADRPSPTSSLHFDGNNYVAIPSGIDISNKSFTIDFWARKTVSGASYLIGNGSTSGGTNQSLHIGFRSNATFTFAFYSNDIDVDLSNTEANDGNFHRWSCVYNAGQSGTDRFVYLDGVLVGSDDATGDFSGTGEFRIGTYMFSDGNFMGDIDEVRIWDRALTQAEFQDGLNSLTGSESGLIAYYTMNNVSNPTLIDLTANHNYGTLMSMNPDPISYCQLDMTQTATVTVNSSSASTITKTACDSYTAPDNAVYTTSGTKTAVIPNAASCDSTITINLTINTADASITQSGNVLTATASGAIYSWKNCTTNNVISGETSQNYTATANGDYAVTVTENNCTATSACITVTTTGISSNSNLDSQFSVYPNPNNGSFVIKSNGEGTYSIVNNLGQTIQTVKLTAAQTFYEINNLDNGVYFIVGFKDNQITRQKIVVSK
jgi:hypothetical protein